MQSPRDVCHPIARRYRASEGINGASEGIRANMMAWNQCRAVEWEICNETSEVKFREERQPWCLGQAVVTPTSRFSHSRQPLQFSRNPFLNHLGT
jgi:hypothetical protein